MSGGPVCVIYACKQCAAIFVPTGVRKKALLQPKTDRKGKRRLFETRRGTQMRRETEMEQIPRGVC